MTSKITVNSYNSRSFSANSAIVCNKLNNLFDSIPIILNQENFVLKGNAYRIRQALPESHTLIKLAEKSNQNSGRPKNDMFVSIPLTFRSLLKDVSPSHYRVQAVLLKTESKILILNTYFPTDPGTFQFDDSELTEVLEIIRSVIKMLGMRHVICGGDINADFLRMSGHVIATREFIESIPLSMSWGNFKVDFTHCYEINGITHTNISDNWFWSSELNKYIEK